MKNTPPLAIPFNSADRQLAMAFAAEQSTPQKGMRIYLNTLAVLAVRRYLQYLHIATECTAGESWHPGLRALFDVADLVLPDLGKLECRPVLAGETAIALPPETATDRIGYVAVQFGDSTDPAQPAQLNQAQILGFVPAPATVDPASEPLTELQVANLQPLDALLEHLTQLEATRTESPSSPLQTTQHSASTTSTTVQLRQWLHNIFEPGWQAIESLLIPQTPGYAFRLAAAQRAKLIQLMPSAPIDSDVAIPETPVLYRVALALALKREERDRSSIHLQLHPLGDRSQLPPQIRLAILTETGEVFREIIARDNDTLLQYEIGVQPGEQFSVQVTLGDATATETFIF